MNKRKIYLGIIIILVILLIVIIGMILTKNIKKPISDKKEEEKFSGLIQCIKITENNVENNISNDIVYLEVENNKIKTVEVMKSIHFNDAKDYEEFKNNENLLNPVYDDERYAIEYVVSKKTKTNNDDMNEYTNNYINKGYGCEKIMN